MALFQITCVLLGFGGLRINEVAAITADRLETLIQTKRLPFYKKKRNKIRTVYFGEKGIEALKEVYKNTKDIIFEKNNVIFSSVRATKSVQGLLKSCSARILKSSMRLLAC